MRWVVCLNWMKWKRIVYTGKMKWVVYDNNWMKHMYNTLQKLKKGFGKTFSECFGGWVYGWMGVTEAGLRDCLALSKNHLTQESWNHSSLIVTLHFTENQADINLQNLSKSLPLFYFQGIQFFTVRFWFEIASQK